MWQTKRTLLTPHAKKLNKKQEIYWMPYEGVMNASRMRIVWKICLDSFLWCTFTESSNSEPILWKVFCTRKVESKNRPQHVLTPDARRDNPAFVKLCFGNPFECEKMTIDKLWARPLIILRWSGSEWCKALAYELTKILTESWRICRPSRRTCARNTSMDDRDSTQKWRLFFYYPKFGPLPKVFRKKLTYTSSDLQMYIAASHEHRKII